MTDLVQGSRLRGNDKILQRRSVSMRLKLSKTLLLGLALLLAPASLHAQEGVRLGLLYTPEYQPGLVVLPFGSDGASGVVQGLSLIHI